MQTYSNQKPEYVLKRANDLINTATGNGIKEKTWALEILHNFIAAKKKVSQWSKVFEQLMKRHLELCIDLKNPHFAKDGLHQYRNLCQTLDPNSLEVVIMHMMDLTESEATAARAKADKVALLAAAKVADLDQEESPESIMLSSMTEEGAKDRTDREVVVPWLRFLWETYRAVLELLHKLPKLEKVYHKICEKAFKFCQEYSRTMEFRRLCEMLRNHLKNMQNAPARPGKAAFEWTSEIVELHLQTRFYQLEVATNLELWNEGFRTVEDIHAITVASRKTPKPKLMAVFYEKLTRIFWVAGNHLFHAFAWARYFTLTCECRRDLKQEERSLLASFVLLSAISIPSLKDIDHSVISLEDEALAERNQQMANLLDFQTHPSRKALLAEIVSKGLLADVAPELASLYDLLDVKFHPLTLVSSLAPVLAFVKGHSVLTMYAVPLKRVIVLRVVQQLSKVYSVVKLDFLRKLVGGLGDLSAVQVEKIVVDGVLHRELQLTVDHASGCLRFSPPPIAGIVDTQVSLLGADLNKIKRDIDKVSADRDDTAQLSFFARVKEQEEKDHQALLNRRNLIEQRKIDIEHAQDEKERAQQIILSQEDAKRQADEAARLELERIRREEEKRQKLQEKEDLKRVKLELERLGVYKDESALAALEPAARQALVTEAKLELVRAKEEENRKVTEHARRLDHIARAIRIEAADVVRKRYDEQLAADVAMYEQERARIAEESKAEHYLRVEEKKRLSRMQSTRTLFEQSLLADQMAAYSKRMQLARDRAVREHRERKVATARRLLDEEEERLREEQELEREKKEKEERARIEREQYEALRRKREEEEAEVRAKEAEEERVRAERAKEIEAKRLRILEENKRKLAEDQAARAAGPGLGSALSEHGKEKEIVWRKPSSVIAAEAAAGSVSASESVPNGTGTGSLGPPSISDSDGDWSRVGPPPSSVTTPAASAPWRPSVARVGSTGGAAVGTAASTGTSKLDEWSKNRPPASGGGGTSKLDEWSRAAGSTGPSSTLRRGESLGQGNGPGPSRERVFGDDRDRDFGGTLNRKQDPFGGSGFESLRSRAPRDQRDQPERKPGAPAGGPAGTADTDNWRKK